MNSHSEFCENETIRFQSERASLDSVFSNISLKKVPIAVSVPMEFDESTMEVIEYIETDDPQMGGKVARIYDDGYWIMGLARCVVSRMPVAIYQARKVKS